MNNGKNRYDKIYYDDYVCYVLPPKIWRTEDFTPLWKWKCKSWLSKKYAWEKSDMYRRVITNNILFCLREGGEESEDWLGFSEIEESEDWLGFSEIEESEDKKE